MQNLYNPISLKITAYKSTGLSIRETASPYLTHASEIKYSNKA